MMAILNWTSDLDTGIAEIDNQHRRIVDYINRLNELRHTHDRAGLSDVIGEMVDYTMSHFAFEEALMEQAEYAFSQAHRSVHETFIKRVEKFRERFIAGEDIADELYDVLKRWLINHIQRDDAAYVRPVTAHLGSLSKEEPVAAEGEVQGECDKRKQYDSQHPGNCCRRMAALVKCVRGCDIDGQARHNK